MPDRDAKPISLWDTTAAEPLVAHPFEQRAGVVDVAIVGGGYTGLATALYAAKRGLSAHVLEAHQIGHGGSGRNVGLVNAGVWHPPAAVRKALGETNGTRFLKRFGAGPAQVFDLIERYQIRCEATRSGTIHAAHAPAGLRDLEGRHAEWRRFGAPVEMLSPADMARMTGSRAYSGGLLDRRAGTINPMGYCRGLARAALAEGAQISTNQPVTSLRQAGGVWVLATPAGELRARHIVLATNAYTDQLWPDLCKVFTPIPYFQLATAPLGEDAAHILPGRQGLWDTATIMTSVRRDAADRLVIGSMGAVVGSAGQGLSRRWAAKRLARLFPDLGPVTFEQAWHGQIAMTPDHLPRIYRLAPGLYTPIGYNGRGIITGTIFGECMADLISGADPAALPLPISQFSTVRGAPVMSRLYRAAFTANQIWKSL